MEYSLKKDIENTIAIFVNPEHRDRGQDEPVWIGSIDNQDRFYGNERYLLDMEDIRLVVHVADQIRIEGFDKMYNSL